MYEAGALPRSYATTTNDDQVTWMQQGRAAFTVLPFARYAQLNRQDQSKYPGTHQGGRVSDLGGAARARCRWPRVVEFWAMSIPHNARDKDLAWSFIQDMSSKAVTLGAARNGNGPVRISTYARSGLRGRAAAGAASRRRRWPTRACRCRPFPNAARAQAMFLEEVQLAVLGRKSPKDAVAAISERVKPLMPS